MRSENNGTRIQSGNNIMKILQATNGILGTIGGILACLAVAGLGISPFAAISRRRHQGPPRRRNEPPYFSAIA